MEGREKSLECRAKREGMEEAKGLRFKVVGKGRRLRQEVYIGF